MKKERDRKDIERNIYNYMHINRMKERTDQSERAIERERKKERERERCEPRLWQKNVLTKLMTDIAKNPTQQKSEDNFSLCSSKHKNEKFLSFDSKRKKN